MAKILKGKRKDECVEISQFCNDWFMLADGKIVSPTSLQFSVAEIRGIVKAQKKGQCGILFGLYELQGDRFFKRKRRRL